MTQTMRVLDYIMRNGSITTMQAFHLGITRLASRVHDLRKLEIPVQKEMVTVTNQLGEKCKVALYTIPGGFDNARR